MRLPRYNNNNFFTNLKTNDIMANKIMNYKKTTIEWKPVSEYAGGRVLATNGLDIII